MSRRTRILRLVHPPSYLITHRRARSDPTRTRREILACSNVLHVWRPPPARSRGDARTRGTRSVRLAHALLWTLRTRSWRGRQGGEEPRAVELSARLSKLHEVSITEERYVTHRAIGADRSGLASCIREAP